MPAAFKAVTAVRENVPLLIGLQGPPGGGKTKSALLLAQGMQQVRGGPIRLIDTEARRSTKYADQIPFEIVEFDPPFRSDRFEEAIVQQLADNPAAIIVDSLSDEHEGLGGILDWHEEELDRILGDKKGDWALRDKRSQDAWRRPKAARGRLRNTILRIKSVPLIFTIRAREKTKPIAQQKNGRTVFAPTNIGMQPIAPMEFVHAMDVTCLLPARSDGVPLWHTGNTFEDFTIKLPDYLRAVFADGGPITPAIGAALAKWARGDSDSVQPSRSMPRRTLYSALLERAELGTPQLKDAWDKLNEKQREAMQQHKAELDRIATDADHAFDREDDGTVVDFPGDR